MVKQILSEAGFEEGKTFKETRFLKPPKSTYAIYLDSYISRGSDKSNMLKEHSYTIELYSQTPDPEAEYRIENVLDTMGLEYEKQDRYWIQEEQLYQVSYDFDYIEKLRR